MGNGNPWNCENLAKRKGREEREVKKPRANKAAARQWNSTKSTEDKPKERGGQSHAKKKWKRAERRKSSKTRKNRRNRHSSGQENAFGTEKRRKRKMKRSNRTHPKTTEGENKKNVLDPPHKKKREGPEKRKKKGEVLGG